MKNKKKYFNFFCVAFFALAVTSFVSYTGLLDWVEAKAYDSRIRLTSDEFPASDEISLVLLDQESLDWAKKEKGWSWPWPRAAYASLVKYFNRAGAATLAFDMIYSEPSLYGSEDDEVFAKACAEYGRVIQTIYYDSNGTVVKPVEPLEKTAAALANITSSLDEDGVCRRGIFYAPQGEAGMVVTCLNLAGLDADSLIQEIPPAKKSGMYVRYKNELASFVPYSAAEILKSEYEAERAELAGEEPCYEDDLIDPEQFEDGYVFFGLFAPGLFDICSTPVSNTYAGLGVHVCQLNTILDESYISDIPVWLSLLILAVCALAGTLLGTRISFSKIKIFIFDFLIFALLTALYVYASYYFFIKGFILPAGAGVFALVLSYIAAIFFNYFTEGKQKLYLKSAFRQYLSPAIIESLIENPELLKLGGERREITAYFSDVQGFTSISEGLTPEQLTAFLNRYLSAMSDIILEYGGTIDKYEGDAIIAFWNAPSNQEDHARRAVEAALACQKKLASMQEELFALTGKPVLQRIGLNTGYATVGNFGSSKRFDYTMMGDTVNLASRLEGINKQFGTYTMCSEATYKSAVRNGCSMQFRNVARIAVVGRVEPVSVFVPMNEAEFNSCASVRELFEKALSLFEAGDFNAALTLFKRGEDEFNDKPSASYVARCRAFIENPPEKWQGFLKATEK